MTASLAARRAYDQHRSEAFAEDVQDFVERSPAPPGPAPLRWLINLLPLGVALMGVAFAVLPPTA